MPSFQFLQRSRPLLYAFYALLLVACTTVAPTDQAPAKSPNDSYQYRLLTLENQMQVLLISDPDTSKAAASLDVMVGSGDNPDGRGGLAHFLEHMLFLGTDKYPDPAEYERYITEHGGTRNAYTSFENTNYFFDINAAYLPEALDRFAQFFIAPRFDDAYVDREKQAVEAEYQMGLTSDGRRGLDVVQEVMNPAHPFSQFAVGSLDTLADRPDSAVRDELISFYDKHYSANMMRLTVLGSQNLDELQALVVPMFSPVPNKSFEHEAIESPLFAPGSLPLLVEVRPQATLRELEVSFPIPDYRPDYRVKPESYVANLVGHEGEGSLLSQLKAEGLAESLYAGSGLSWRGGALFSVGISLTEKGVSHYQRVVELLFNYMDMLRARGALEWLYDEQSSLAELQFRFKEQVEPMSYVSGISRGMQHYAPADVLRGPYMMDQYEQQVLNDLLGRITINNALIVLSDANVETDRVSQYYQVPYAVRSLDAEQVAALRGVDQSAPLHLPEPNQFIAEDVSMVEVAATNPPVPAVALQLPRQQIWFQQDDEFKVPKGATYINFRSPEVGQNARQTAAAVLYTALLKDNVNEFAYPAMLAGLSFDIYKHAQGMSLRISGYNDKQAVLLQELLGIIEAPQFDPARFENIRKDMIRSLENAVANPPINQVMNDLRESLLYGEWGEQPLIDALQQLDLAALQAYAGDFWASATAEALIYGNYPPSYIDELSAMLSQVVLAEPAPALPDLKVLELESGESVQYAVDVAHDDSVVAWYLQGAANTWQDRGVAALTAQIMKSGFFQELRTEQQLGYSVMAFAWPQLDVPGLVMLIQSPVADAAAVQQAMQAFMLKLPSDVDEAQFERHRKALVNEILQPDKNLWDRAAFYWQSIAMKEYGFDSREQLATVVEGITLESWLAYYQKVFLDQRHSLQVVAPGKWGVVPKGEARAYDSAEAIKRGHAAYTIE